MSTRRSGWTNVRVCCDCNQVIRGDRCACPSEHSFVKGLEVTVCAGEHPLYFAVVGRVGNGRFRLEKTGNWYDFQGEPSHGSPAGTRVRPRLPGDELLLNEREANRRMLIDIERWDKAIAESLKVAAQLRIDASQHLRDALRLEALARDIFPDARGEAARVKAEGEARAEIKKNLDAAKSHRDRADADGKTARVHDARVQDLRAKIDALPNEVQSIRMLGDKAALRAYLLPEPVNQEPASPKSG